MQTQMQDWGDVNEWNKINFNVVAYKNTQTKNHKFLPKNQKEIMNQQNS